MKVKYLGNKNSTKVLEYSPNLLDSVKRSQINTMSYYGIDYWNVYEFSFLNAENKPNLETIEIKISVDSNFTVESKSLKIYLASFYKMIHEKITQACKFSRHENVRACRSACTYTVSTPASSRLVASSCTVYFPRPPLRQSWRTPRALTRC